jgi:hypothetical protein
MMTPNASIQVLGADLKLDGGWMGEGYLGYSAVIANHASVISDAIEVIHSQGGWQLSQNYFPKTGYTADTGDGGCGTIHSVAGQYTFSLASFMMRPRPFWGQGADVTLRLFGMYNKVTGSAGGVDDVSKLKYGGEATWSFSPIVAAALRLDSVNPNMSDSTNSFYVISPKLIFRSEFVTHEMIVLQYSGYVYGSAYTNASTSPGVMPWPYGQYGTLQTSLFGKNGSPPDKHVISLSASMWW